jgi:hypothetical protein
MSRAAGSSCSNRAFVMVERGLFDLFHRRWAAIESCWAGAWTSGDPDALRVAYDAIRLERADLREEVRRLAPSMPGPCLVAV